MSHLALKTPYEKEKTHPQKSSRIRRVQYIQIRRSGGKKKKRSGRKEIIVGGRENLETINFTKLRSWVKKDRKGRDVLPKIHDFWTV